jgi:hypothetical protein
LALLPSVWVAFGRYSDFRQHAGQHFEAEVLFVPQAVGTPLQHADLGVEAFDEAQGDLVLGLAL